jgi:quinol monooxygenase YgiN
MSKSGLQTLPKVRRSTKEVESMKDERIYLLAELTILPEFLEEVKAILKEALVPTLQEPGCETLYETGRDDDPHKLVFFEVFSSAASS